MELWPAATVPASDYTKDYDDSNILPIRHVYLQNLYKQQHPSVEHSEDLGKFPRDSSVPLQNILQFYRVGAVFCPPLLCLSVHEADRSLHQEGNWAGGSVQEGSQCTGTSANCQNAEEDSRAQVQPQFVDWGSLCFGSVQQTNVHAVCPNSHVLLDAKRNVSEESWLIRLSRPDVKLAAHIHHHGHPNCHLRHAILPRVVPYQRRDDSSEFYCLQHGSQQLG